LALEPGNDQTVLVGQIFETVATVDDKSFAT
jgi:hypothetical protein